MKTTLQILKNRKKQETCLEGSAREQPTSLPKRLSANSKYENEYNLKHIIIARLIPGEKATLNVQHWYALWYSNPKTRLVGSLAIFGEIHIRVCWY
jgi:hypothetical protein